MIKTDVLIAGAGLSGCFTARNLAEYRIDVVVLEKEADVCRGISRANTGIIYSGYNNSPGSLKQRLCVRANENFDRLCSELEVPFRRTGSLMTGYGPRADAVIARKYSDGIKSGLRGLRLIGGREAESMEPALARGITSALYSSETGTLDPWELCIAAYENARDNGIEFRFREGVVSARRENGGFSVETDKETYFAKVFVNAAGLLSDSVRELVEKPEVRIFPSAADYMVFDRAAGRAVNHIVLHEGEDGKGLTLVPAIDGSLLAGPTNRQPSEDERAARDMRTDPEGLGKLKELIERVIPSLDLSLQIRTFGTLRPDPYYVEAMDGKILRKAKSIKDILIMEEDGLFSLIGIKTPGLTISNEIGRIVAKKAAEYAGRTTINIHFNPCRRAIIRARDLSQEERAGLVYSDPDYGEVVCQCMDVTRSEVLQAVQRGAFDFESVKRRVGAGFGSCQGSRCRRRVMKILNKGGEK